MSFLEDSGPGVHDTTAAACSYGLYVLQIGEVGFRLRVWGAALRTRVVLRATDLQGMLIFAPGAVSPWVGTETCFRVPRTHSASERMSCAYPYPRPAPLSSAYMSSKPYYPCGLRRYRASHLTRP